MQSTAWMQSTSGRRKLQSNFNEIRRESLLKCVHYIALLSSSMRSSSFGLSAPITPATYRIERRELGKY